MRSWCFSSVRLLGSPENVIKSKRIYVKKVRSASRGEMVGVRLQPPELDAIDAWRGTQPESLTRPEAIRRLVAAALASEPE